MVSVIYSELAKFLGGIIGSALGDAIGEMAFDYYNRAELLKQLTEFPQYVYTDDTAMALGLAQSILSTNGEIDCQNLGDRFAENFYREPYRGYAVGPPTIFNIVKKTGKSCANFFP